MTTKVKHVTLDYNDVFVLDAETGEEVFTPPNKWYIINALGQYVFAKARSREDAQKIIDSVVDEDGDFLYKGRYKVQCASSDSSRKGEGQYSATGSNSRRGMMSHLKKTV